MRKENSRERRFCNTSVCLPAIGETDAANLIQTKAEFSHAVAVMDQVGGWHEEGRVEDKQGLRMQTDRRINSKAVICNGQRYMESLRGQKRIAVIEAINGVCTRVQENPRTTFLRTFQFDIEVPCVVLWGLLWCSALTSLKNNLMKNGLMLATYSRVVDKHWCR